MSKHRNASIKRLWITFLSCTMPALCLAQWDPGVVYRYHFDQHPSVAYRVTEHTRSIGSVHAGQVDITMTYDSTVRFRLVLTPLSRKKGSTVLQVECENVKANWNVKIGTNILVLCLSQDGALEGKFNSSAVEPKEDNDYRKEIAGLFIRGEVEVKPSGVMTVSSGDEDFMRYWGRWERICPVVFPEHRISVGDSWNRTRSHRAANVLMKAQLAQLQEANLTDRDFAEEVTVEHKPPLDVNGRKCAIFNLKGKPLVAHRRTISSDSSSMSVPQSHSTGTVMFDLASGLILNSSTRHDAQWETTKTRKGKKLRTKIEVVRSIEMSRDDQQ